MSVTNKDSGGGDGHEVIDDDVKGWRTAMAGAAIFCFFIYSVSFCFAWNDNQTEGFYKGWSAIGNFIGGVLGPIVAFAAFYWLTESVKIQRVELKKAHDALLDSAAAQKDQSESSRRLVRINALSALAEAAERQVQFLNNRISECEEALARVDGTPFASGAVYETMVENRRAFISAGSAAASERDSYFAELKVLAK